MQLFLFVHFFFLNSYSATVITIMFLEVRLLFQILFFSSRIVGEVITIQILTGSNLNLLYSLFKNAKKGARLSNMFGLITLVFARYFS